MTTNLIKLIDRKSDFKKLIYIKNVEFAFKSGKDSDVYLEDSIVYFMLINNVASKIIYISLLFIFILLIFILII